MISPGFVAFAVLIASAFGQLTLASKDADLKTVAQSNTEFTLELYNVLNKSNDGNLIFSPFSLSTVMAMLKAGAAGRTATDIQEAMNFPSSDNTLKSGYSALLSSLKNDGKTFTLDAANKIYAQQGFDLNPRFTSDLQKYYKADVKQLDFGQSAASAKEINDFVSTSTHGKIKDLFSESDLNHLTRLVLVNAIYFKGHWKTPFPKLYTVKMPFHLPENKTVEVDMMYMRAHLPYADITELNAEAVALPYKGDRLSMVILLPKEIDGLKDMETKLQSFKLSTLQQLLDERRVTLQMPRFTLESTIELKDPLTTLGAGNMFDPSEADFSGIAVDPKQKLFVSKAVQKAFIEVNEEGTTAAATSMGGVETTGYNPSMRADHPFVAMIVDGQTNSILFFTTLTNPTKTHSPRTSTTAGSSGLAVAPLFYELVPFMGLLTEPLLFH